MNKLETITLDNGLKIYLYNDLRRHSTFFQLTTFCGGITKHFEYDGKRYDIQDGVAHILEHYIVECNDNGNFLDKLGDMQMQTNAGTSLKCTNYYFEAVENVKYGIETILNGVYNVTFKKEKLEKLKNPIYQEIRGKMDNKFYHLNKIKIKNIFNEIDYNDIGGSLDEVKNTSIDDLEVLYNAFYRPSNQFITIAGNFDKDEVLDTINNFYNNLKKNYKESKLIDYNEKTSVRKKEEVFYFPTPMSYCDISFKIDISKYSNSEILDLDFYVHVFFSSTFGISSKLHKKLIDEEVIIDYIGFGTTIINNYWIMSIGAYTNDIDKFKENIFNVFNKFNTFDKDRFELDQKNSIVGLILRDESIFKMIFPFLDNVINYNYPYLDKIEDIKRLNYNDYVKYIKELDLSNYTISIIKDKKK